MKLMTYDTEFDRVVYFKLTKLGNELRLIAELLGSDYDTALVLTINAAGYIDRYRLPDWLQEHCKVDEDEKIKIN